MLRGDVSGRLTPQETIVFINIGAQGVQFAAVAGRAYELALERGIGSEITQDWYLQNIRN
jgi:ornithine cyclodeaminase/alanine dehydrogenase-like protein (mu-crystallin family)